MSTRTTQTEQVTIFDDLEETAANGDEALLVEDDIPVGELPEDEEYELVDLAELLGYLEVPLLLVDTDTERAVARQKEMMAACFGGIGEETKPEKRTGLAMQQLDVEQRQALRLLLHYHNAEELTAHLTRCLEEPEYGYGERGDNGRTIAQAMNAVSDGDMSGIVSEWLAAFSDVRLNILSGYPFNFRSLFDFCDLDTFVPLVTRVGDMSWQLGLEGEGKHMVFQGDVASIWPQLCDTFVAWCDKDNQDWLAGLKKQAEKRLPETILRVARAERLRKEKLRLAVENNRVTLEVERSKQSWPLSIVLGEQVGLSRLSGHSFYELTWQGGYNVRRFEISGPRIKNVPFEHIELAFCMAEIVFGQGQGNEDEAILEPVSPQEIEAAYLRRLKAKRAEVLAPQITELPRVIRGKPVATYKVNDMLATIIHGDNEAVAYITSAEDNQNGVNQGQGVLLFRDERQGVMAAVPVNRGRPVRGNRLMTTPLADLNLKSGDWLRVLCVWGAWLFKVAVQRQ